MKWIRLILINLITFSILLFAVNWAAGKYLRATATGREELPNYESDSGHAREVFRDYRRVQHDYYPFVGWKTLPYSGKTTTISAEGNRVHPRPDSSVKPSKVVRFFGGSTMWGEGSDDQHTIPALFNRHFPDYEVHNHAQLAYNTRQELDALISLYTTGKSADLVIFYDGVNDAAFLCPAEIDELPAHRLVPMFRGKIYVSQAKLVKEALYKYFAENIAKVIQKFSGPPTQSPYDCLSDPDKAEAIAEIMMQNWELAHDLVTSRGGKFLALLQPAALVGNPKTDHLELDENLRQNFAAVYDRIKEKIAERNHQWIVDVSDRFDRQEYIYIDFCHVSPNGNELMAETIAQLVTPL